MDEEKKYILAVIQPYIRVFTRKPGGKRQAKEDLLEMMTAISPDPLYIKDSKILG